MRCRGRTDSSVVIIHLCAGYQQYLAEEHCDCATSGEDEEEEERGCNSPAQEEEDEEEEANGSSGSSIATDEVNNQYIFCYYRILLQRIAGFRIRNCTRSPPATKRLRAVSYLRINRKN